jgi:CheY-like chemotaxis protein
LRFPGKPRRHMEKDPPRWCSSGRVSSGTTPLISSPPNTDVPPNAVKLLYAEDEVLLRLMLADALHEAGFQVFEASDGEESISILKTMSVDVVVTDLRMATLTDGLELAFQVNQQSRLRLSGVVKASSVPGRRQTAVLQSSGAANARVPVLKYRVRSFSPTLAGRDFTCCRL